MSRYIIANKHISYSINHVMYTSNLFALPICFTDTSCGSGKMKDIDSDIAVSKEVSRFSELNFEENWDELTWEEKVVEVLHIVRCQEFTEYDPKTRDFVPTRFCRFNIAFFDFEKECEYIHDILI